MGTKIIMHPDTGTYFGLEDAVIIDFDDCTADDIYELHIHDVPNYVLKHAKPLVIKEEN